MMRYRILKAWSPLAIEVTSIANFQPHKEVQGLYKFQGRTWYNFTHSFYMRHRPLPGQVLALELREKVAEPNKGLSYFYLYPIEVKDFDKALIVFDSGDLWRSSWSLKIIRGDVEVVSESCGGSRGGAHWQEMKVVVASIGSIFQIYNAGFKSRYPSTRVVRLEKAKICYKINDTTVEVASPESVQRYQLKYFSEPVVVPVLQPLGEAEDVAVLEDLGEL